MVTVAAHAMDAAWQGVPPARLHSPPPPPPAPRRRTVSLFLQGWNWLLGQVLRGRLWRRLWLTPEPWPAPLPGVVLTLAQPP